MSVSRPFILRPVATTLMIVGVVLLGLLGYRLLPVSALPAVEFPTIEVSARLPGAAPDVMAALVTTPLEHQLGQIAGLSAMRSVSAFGTSRITLQFALGRDIEAAAQDVQAQINAATGLLPLDLMPSRPAYNKVNPADTPVLILALTADQLPLRQVNDLADTLVVQKLSQVSGVGLVTTEGGQKAAVRVRLDPGALAGLGLSLGDVAQALRGATASGPKGALDGPRQSFQISTDDQLLDAAAYAEQIVAERGGAPVRVKDVGSAVDGVENDRLAGWADGRPAVILNIQRQPGANVIAVADAVRALLPQLVAALPPTVRLTVLTDRTATIRASIADMQFTLALSVALVVLVIFLFLRRLWATVIPSITLPVSLIATFGVMALAGFSLDNLSLMALAIAAGFLVDDAIVMIENIVRHLEAGATPLVAALNGARQIGFTIVSLTVSLIAVFLPLLLMEGVVGRLFHEFAVTLSAAVAISAAVSLTLTPMMCATLLPAATAAKPPGRLLAWSEAWFDGLLGRYQASLGFVLRHQTATLVITGATVAATLLLYLAAPKGFLPDQDTSLIIGVTDAAPEISFAAMAVRQQDIAAVVQRDPDVVSVSSFVGTGTINTTGNTGRLYINLKPVAERRAGVVAIMARLKAAVAGVQGMTLYLQAAQDLAIGSSATRTQYQYLLQSADPAALNQWSERLVAALRGQPDLADVVSDAQYGGLAATLAIDRDAAARLGVAVRTINETLYDAFGQRQIATLYTQTNQYHVVLEVDPRFRQDPAALGRLFVKSAAGAMVPLSAVARVTLDRAPLALTHQGPFPAVTLSFNVPPGGSLGAATAAIGAAEQAIGLPEGVSGRFIGSAAEFHYARDNQLWLILAAVITVYIVLGILYESYIHPITILSTLPAAGAGALLALIVTGHDLDVIALIGIILLIGIVKKNAIMMIDFALDAQRRQGLAAPEAIVQACLLRFRPIMMTTFAALLGALPLALAGGAGAELRQPLGIAMVGGLMVSQLLSLYTTPVIFLAFDRLQQRLRRAAARPAAAE